MSSYNNNIRKSRPSSSSSSYARPRSVYSSPSRSGNSIYSSLGLSSSPYLNTSSYSSTIPSYNPSTYGGTASGYGGLTITPSSNSSFSSYANRNASPSRVQLSHASPSSRSQSPYVPPLSRQSPSYTSSPARPSRAPLKRNYNQNPLSRFDSSNSLASNKSYGSEGYVVSNNVIVMTFFKNCVIFSTIGYSQKLYFMKFVLNAKVSSCSYSMNCILSCVNNFYTMKTKHSFG